MNGFIKWNEKSNVNLTDVKYLDVLFPDGSIQEKVEYFTSNGVPIILVNFKGMTIPIKADISIQIKPHFVWHNLTYKMHAFYLGDTKIIEGDKIEILSEKGFRQVGEVIKGNHQYYLQFILNDLWASITLFHGLTARRIEE